MIAITNTRDHAKVRVAVSKRLSIRLPLRTPCLSGPAGHGTYVALSLTKAGRTQRLTTEVEMSESNNMRSIDRAAGVVDRATRVGRQAIEDGYENVREYGEKSLDYIGQVG